MWKFVLNGCEAWSITYTENVSKQDAEKYTWPQDRGRNKRLGKFT
jgi:hypothetical protein